MSLKVTVAEPEEKLRALLVEFVSAAGFHVDSVVRGRALQERMMRRSSDLYVSSVQFGDISIFEILRSVKDPPLLFVTVPFARPAHGIEAMKLGAYDYLTLPPNPVEVHMALQRASKYLRYQRQSKDYDRIIAEQSEVEALKKALTLLKDAYYGTLEALVAALDAREHETCNHSKRVGAYALHLGANLELTSKQLEDVSRGALLHDVGKIGVPDEILLKPGPLTKLEWLEMMRHPSIGYNILKDIRQLKDVGEIVLSHQEKYDGSGYPRMLAKEEICMGARIFAVVDAFDAMTTDRPYRKATTIRNAKNEIARQSGVQFDPDVVTAFMDVAEDDWMVIKTTLG